MMEPIRALILFDPQNEPIATGVVNAVRGGPFSACYRLSTILETYHV